MHTMLTTSSEDGTPPRLEPSGPVYGVSTEGIQYQTDDSIVPSDVLRRERLPKNWDLLRKLQRATLIARQKHYPSVADDQLSKSNKPSESVDGLEALLESAKRGAERKAGANWQHQKSIHQASEHSPISSYADSLSPLRDRDHEALSGMFKRDDIAEIEADVTYCLARLLPEPCWEDNPFDFLKEFL